MSTKKISVVVPTYNQARYLGACLDSIWFQEWPNLEIIVVADPSPDDTGAVLDEFARAVKKDTASFASRLEDGGEISRTVHPRYPQQGRELVVIRNPARMGHTPSYNLGFRRATGDYVTYVASDDICHPGMLAALADPLDAGRADFAYSDMFVVDDSMRILRAFRLPDYSFKACFCDWYLCGVSKLYRRDLHEKHGYFDEAHTANDHECYLRFAMGGARFEHVPRVLYSVRSHEGRGQDVHSGENEAKVLAESAELVRRAREFADPKNKDAQS